VTVAAGRTVTPAEVLGEPRPGRKLVLTGDTAPSPLVVQAAHEADLLVHEASFLTEEAERARETLHSTAADAAEVARLAQVRLLALTHVSPRYFGPELAEEAGGVFPDTVVPRDFDLIEVPFPERGAPRLVKSGAKAGSTGGEAAGARLEDRAAEAAQGRRARRKRL
jgi:ribonuclease Z